MVRCYTALSVQMTRPQRPSQELLSTQLTQFSKAAVPPQQALVESTPSTSVFPHFCSFTKAKEKLQLSFLEDKKKLEQRIITSKSCIKKVLMDLLLSMTVSLPTSRRPICLGSILYFSRRDVTALKLRNTDQHIETQSLHESNT